MSLSNKWNLTDNVYFQSRNTVIEKIYNNGIMGLFEKKHDGKVNKCIVDYAKSHTRNETFGFNNNLYFGIVNPKQVHNEQYETNRKFILNYFQSVSPDCL